MSENDAVSIEGLSKPAVLAALYNASKQQGMGFMHARGATGMSVEQAAQELERGTYFDYLHGRVMKVDLKSDREFDPWSYDRDNGRGAAASVIAELRAQAVAI